MVRIRASFGIHSDDYLRSVGPEQLLGNMVLGNLSSLSELSSEGKSGAFFYYTSDGRLGCRSSDFCQKVVGAFRLSVGTMAKSGSVSESCNGCRPRSRGNT
ncbi:unnamed protein product [Symbiodinium necroappetens]|uniref:Uncharacterized protein n=1 Tax=Symbiodinium necroappetens TaxID=1628268 RepID=A0A812ULG8_9DINO|nr:unnamed protein product [Symbiodinium necroappetens]